MTQPVACSGPGGPLGSFSKGDVWADCPGMLGGVQESALANSIGDSYVEDRAW